MQLQKIFFDNWESIVKTGVLSVLGYVTMVALLRFTGKRTLSKFNAFDFVITVALGSSLSAVCINRDVTLAQGATCFFILMGMQFLLSKLAVHFSAFRNVITSRPALLFYKGEFFEGKMKRERITRDEMFSVSREKGIGSLKDIHMIVLERTGDLTIIEVPAEDGISTSSDVQGRETSQNGKKIQESADNNGTDL